MELVSLNEGPKNSLVCSVMDEPREKLATCEPKNGPHQDDGKYCSLFISHQVYGKLAYHRKRDQDLMEKSKRDKKKTKKRQYGKKWWKWTHTLLVFGAPRNSCQFRRPSIEDMNTLAFRTDSIAWPKMYNNRNKVYILIHLRKWRLREVEEFTQGHTVSGTAERWTRFFDVPVQNCIELRNTVRLYF